MWIRINDIRLIYIKSLSVYDLLYKLNNTHCIYRLGDETGFRLFYDTMYFGEVTPYNAKILCTSWFEMLNLLENNLEKKWKISGFTFFYAQIQRITATSFFTYWCVEDDFFWSPQPM